MWCKARLNTTSENLEKVDLDLDLENVEKLDLDSNKLNLDLNLNSETQKNWIKI